MNGGSLSASISGLQYKALITVTQNLVGSGLSSPFKGKRGQEARHHHRLRRLQSPTATD
jgi:hypothetical protein